MGGPRGAKFSEAHDVVMTSMRRHVPSRFLINQCQIITFFILKYDIIENSRIELRGIVLPVQVGGLLGGGGGAKGYVGPPSQIIGGGPGPPGPPSSYAYVSRAELQHSNDQVISWSFPSFLFKELKMDFRPVYTHI